MPLSLLPDGTEWEQIMDEALNRHAELVGRLRRAVFDSAGETDPAVRQAAGAGRPLPAPWAAYADTVRDHSYRITDADISALKAAACSEEEIFEITIAVAMGAALRRLDAGLRALRGGDPT
jgi:alkylhydroperoxidase family enzyme